MQTASFFACRICRCWVLHFFHVISKTICVHHYSVALTINSKVIANLTEMRTVAILLFWTWGTNLIKEGKLKSSLLSLLTSHHSWSKSFFLSNLPTGTGLHEIVQYMIERSVSEIQVRALKLTSYVTMAGYFTS